MFVDHEFSNPFIDRMQRAEGQLKTIVAESERILSELSITAENFISEDRLSYEVKITECGGGQDFKSLSFLVGECAHNMRSALDNLVYALARLQDNPPRHPQKLCFPICTDIARFGDAKKTLTSMIRSDDLAIIEHLQPCQRVSQPGGGVEVDPLYVLSAINNFDKHRIPISVNVHIPESNHVALTFFGSDELAKLNEPPDFNMFCGGAKVGTVLMSGRFKTPVVSMSGVIQLKAELVLDVNGMPYGLVGLMTNAHIYVSSVMKLFEKRFE